MSRRHENSMPAHAAKAALAHKAPDAPPDIAPPDIDEVKRLTLNLSGEAYAELSELARQRKSSMTEVVRLGLGLARIALAEKRAGNKLLVGNQQGQPIRELVLP